VRFVVINGSALLAIRERSGLSQAELSRQSGVSQGRISELEAAQLNVRPATVKAIAEALQVPITALVIEVAS
jgi:transcriptional regulator with XRE-family HTH domain